MKIIAVRTTVVGAPWRDLTCVELVTDYALTGVSEVRMVNKTATSVACIAELSERYVIGRDPFEVERLAWITSSGLNTGERERSPRARSAPSRSRAGT